MAQFRVAVVAVLTLLTPAARQHEPEPAAHPVALMETGEFMELVMKPSYAELQHAIGMPAADRRSWAAMYQAAIRLAETENLLFFRDRPDVKDPRWAALAAAARQASADVARSAEVSLRNLDTADYGAIRRRYEAVSSACNACHRTFAREAPTIRP
ncbi:MAG TPA: hypothetical protein VI258_06330 [Rhodanobacteraceae bacterium]